MEGFQKGVLATVENYMLQGPLVAFEGITTSTVISKCTPSFPVSNVSIASTFCSCRTCGVAEESRKSSRECGQYYSNRERNGCYLEVSGEKVEVCVHVETEKAWSTFKATSLGWCYL